jgi:hypothetical protein
MTSYNVVTVGHSAMSVNQTMSWMLNPHRCGRCRELIDPESPDVFQPNNKEMTHRACWPYCHICRQTSDSSAMVEDSIRGSVHMDCCLQHVPAVGVHVSTFAEHPAPLFTVDANAPAPQIILEDRRPPAGVTVPFWRLMHAWAAGRSPAAEPPALSEPMLEKPPEEFECAVCHEPKPDESSVLKLSCGHRFHVYCILRWAAQSMGQSKNCPICRVKYI